ncbi:MAG: NAD(P)H-dependent oxidoreductase subunit E [Bacillota bacterium]|jgi:NADH-quinone oxidoreductase subunit E
MISQSESAIDLTPLDSLLSSVPQSDMNLIALLQQMQEIYGYSPREALVHISKTCNIPLARLTGIVTFYAQFRLEPPGKYQILVCSGTACHVNDSAKIADSIAKAVGVPEGRVSQDRLFSWERVACLGCCSLSPAIMINGEVYGKLTPERVTEIIEDLRQKELEGSER